MKTLMSQKSHYLFVSSKYVYMCVSRKGVSVQACVYIVVCVYGERVCLSMGHRLLLRTQTPEVAT